ncbi:hypothetical protein LXL04_008166 [Taraxacum kok-saghyz]
MVPCCEETLESSSTLLLLCLLKHMRHWVLVVIDMKAGKCYYLDSLKHSTINQQAMLVYTTQSGSDKRINLMWEQVRVPKQPGNTECGYYVCKENSEIANEATLRLHGTAAKRLAATQVEEFTAGVEAGMGIRSGKVCQWQTPSVKTRRAVCISSDSDSDCRPRTRSVVRAFDSDVVMSDHGLGPTFCLGLGPPKIIADQEFACDVGLGPWSEAFDRRLRCRTRSVVRGPWSESESESERNQTHP